MPSKDGGRAPLIMRYTHRVLSRTEGSDLHSGDWVNLVATAPDFEGEGKLCIVANLDKEGRLRLHVAPAEYLEALGPANKEAPDGAEW